MNDKVKHRRRGRPVKNELADPINDTPENVMRALLQAKPKATEYWYKKKPRKKK
ncbi:MAG: hypothetical protein OXF95_00010 [Rhodobacteraceae bacterium]|nr:hypothetical protein [Paracoccaceae bacterium]